MGNWSSARGKGKGIVFLREHMDDADGPCLIWPMARDNFGYPQCGYNGRTYRVGRLLCELLYGPAPSPKHHAAHSCGRGQDGCVHPKHIRWATPKENMADSVRLGRAGRPRGEACRKLTEEDVAQIIALKGQKTQLEIGLMFGVKGKQIGRIHRGENWAGGKAGHHGFKPGDPRNVGWRKMHAAARRAAQEPR
jgi:hypothetical protein